MIRAQHPVPFYQVEHRNLQPYPFEHHHSRCIIPLANRHFTPRILEPIRVQEGETPVSAPFSSKSSSAASSSPSSSSSSPYVSLTCVAVGSPPPKIDWRVDGDLRPASGLRLLSDSFNGSRVESRLRLSLDAVRRAGATFECHAVNRLGRAAESVKVEASASSRPGLAASLFGDAVSSSRAWSAALFWLPMGKKR